MTASGTLSSRWSWTACDVMRPPTLHDPASTAIVVAQNLLGALRLIGPHEQLHAALPEHPGIHAARVVHADERVDLGGIERALRDVGIEMIREPSHDDEIGFGHGSLSMSPGAIDPRYSANRSL